MREIIREQKLDKKAAEGEAKVRSCSFPCLLTLLTRSALVCCSLLSRLLSLSLSALCLFASWLWTEMGFRARLSFEVLWLSAKRSAVPAAICEGAASSHLSLHFPSMTKRGRSQKWRGGSGTWCTLADRPHMKEPIDVLRIYHKNSALSSMTIHSVPAHFNIPVNTPPLCLYIILPVRLVPEERRKNVDVMRGLIKNCAPFFTPRLV